MIEFVPIGRINRRALASMIASLAALLVLVLDFIPIPFTALICYPASLVLAVSALLSGIGALQQIRQTAETGRALAWIGICIGGMTLLAALCLLALGLAVWPQVRNLLQQFFPQR